VLGADLDMLGFADGYLSMASEAQGVINERLERYQPDLVITHHPNDVHRDHREISRLVTARIDPGVKLAYWEPMLGLSAHPQLLVDISAHTETKATAIVVHRSQHAEETILPSIRTWNAFRGLQLGGRDVTAAEGWVMPPSPFINPQRMLASAARTRALWT
jgi:LmbE family N-acetylglucosaminyl deacetylase